MHRFRNIDLNREKCCLFTRDGGILWRSPAWGDSAQVPISEIADFRWLEFVHAKDVNPVLNFFRESETKMHEFRAYSIAEKSWVCVILYKVPCDLGWLCFGDTYQIETPSDCATGGPSQSTDFVISGVLAVISSAATMPPIFPKTSNL